MADARKCDLCGKFYECNENQTIEHETITRIKIIYDTGHYEMIDLCDECAQKVMRMAHLEPNVKTE